MLPDDVMLLAADTYKSGDRQRRKSLIANKISVLSQAAKGVGSGHQDMMGVCEAVVVNRAEAIGGAIRVAIDSHGVTWYEEIDDDVEAAFDTLAEPLDEVHDAVSEIAKALRWPTGTDDAANKIVDAVASDARNAKLISLRHFTAQLKTKQRASRLTFRERIWTGVIGGVLGALAVEIINWGRRKLPRSSKC
jgi:hypothetical protein